MNINTFFTALKKIQDSIASSNIITLITQLNGNINNYYTQIIQQRQRGVLSPNETTIKKQIIASSNQVKEAYKELIESFDDINTLLSFRLLGLDKIQKEPIEIIFEKIDNLTDTDTGNYNNYLIPYQQKLSKVNQLRSASSIYELSDAKIEEFTSDALALYFREGVAVEYLDELSKSATHWNQIIHCFSRLTSDENNKAKIETIEKGSIIMTITAATTIILALTKASNYALDVILKIYEVKKKSLELKNLKLTNLNEAISLLDKQSELNVQIESDNIASKLLKEYNILPDDNETKNGLFLSLRRIIRFINAGGKIEPKLLTDSKEANQELLSSIETKNKELLSIEEEIKALKTGDGILKLIDDKLEADNENENLESE